MEMSWKLHCKVVVTHGILIAGEVKKEEKVKNLLMWGKLSCHVMVDCQISTHVKNKK